MLCPSLPTRNVTGEWQRGSASENTSANESGAFSGAFEGAGLYRSAKTVGNSNGDHKGYQKIAINVANVVSTSTENRPYSIYALPLIAF